jgi:hypothetical protein
LAAAAIFRVQFGRRTQGLTQTMPSSCCVKDCNGLASIRQPLKLGTELVLHVPLCAAHNTEWERFVSRLGKARKRSALERREADWLLDAALALGLFPSTDPG